MKKYITVILSGVLMIYLMIAFVKLEFNFTKWDEGLRITLVVFSAFIIFTTTGFADINSWFKKGGNDAK